jgi:hypothetical protein
MDARRRFARNRKKLSAESGQTSIFVLLVLGIFFLAFVGLAVDFSNLWFHRQMAQGAADAACQAGAMDLLVDYSGGGPNQGGFTPGTDFDCKDFPDAAPCRYATLNGYTGGTLVANTPGTSVGVSFPGSVPGVSPPPGSIAASPFIRVDVVDRSAVYFSGLLTGKRATDVRAFAVCGLQLAKAPIPIIVLNPRCSHSFQMSGSGVLTIVGGPTKSVQVNSSGGNTTCAAATTNAAGQCSANGPTIDLQYGGPNFVGSNFGTFGGPSTAPPGFVPGTAGSWGSGSPIADPYSQVPAPTQPLTPAPAPALVPYGTDGCPDQTQPCREYFPGWYSAPIVVKNETAIFVPGVYYIKPLSYATAQGGTLCGTAGSGCTAGGSGNCKADFLVDSQGVVRPASNNAPGSDGSGGVIFYMTGPGDGTYGGAVFTANAGSAPSRTIDNFPVTGMSCDGKAPKDEIFKPNSPVTSVPGNVLLAQCTARGTYYGTPSTDTISIPSGVRGLVFFQDRANGYQNGQTNMQGGGGLAISGTLYAHNCPGSPSCNANTEYNAFVQLQGTPGSGTYILGEIVADQLVISGNGAIGMQLNPDAVYFILKASMLR